MDQKELERLEKFLEKIRVLLVTDEQLMLIFKLINEKLNSIKFTLTDDDVPELISLEKKVIEMLFPDDDKNSY